MELTYTAEWIGGFPRMRDSAIDIGDYSGRILESDLDEGFGWSVFHSSMMVANGHRPTGKAAREAVETAIGVHHATRSR